MTIFNTFEFDAVWWDIVLGLLPGLAIVLLAYGSLVLLFQLLLRPRNNPKYDTYNNRNTKRPERFYTVRQPNLRSRRDNRPASLYEADRANQAARQANLAVTSQTQSSSTPSFDPYDTQAASDWLRDRVR